MSKNKKIIYGVLLLAIVLGVFWMFGGKEEVVVENLEPVKTLSGNQVVVTGKTEAVESADLAFTEGGKIAHVYVKIGDKVNTGHLLASLDTSELAANLREVKASEERYLADLAEISRGKRVEEISVYQSKLASAESAFDDAKNQLSTDVDDAYLRANDAVNRYIKQIFDNPSSNNPIADESYDSDNDFDDEQTRLERLVNTWRKELTSTTAGVALTYLRDINNFLNFLNREINNLSVGSSVVTQDDIDNYKSWSYSAGSTINTAISNIVTTTETYNDAEAALEVAKRELDLAKAGATPEELASAKANVSEAQAKVSSIETAIRNRSIFSPINGTITYQEAKSGEVATVNEKLISVLSVGNWQIEANVPEVSVGRVTLGDSVEINLDALPEEKFSGIVTYIEPAETVIDGVVYFKITVKFSETDDRLRSGLTANLRINSSAQ